MSLEYAVNALDYPNGLICPVCKEEFRDSRYTILGSICDCGLVYDYPRDSNQLCRKCDRVGAYKPLEGHICHKCDLVIPYDGSPAVRLNTPLTTKSARAVGKVADTTGWGFILWVIASIIALIAFFAGNS